MSYGKEYTECTKRGIKYEYLNFIFAGENEQPLVYVRDMGNTVIV